MPKRKKSKREKVVKRGVSLPWAIDQWVVAESRKLGIGRSAFISQELAANRHAALKQSLVRPTPGQKPQHPTPAD